MIDISCVFAFCVFVIVSVLESGVLFFGTCFHSNSLICFRNCSFQTYYDVYKKTILQNHSNFSQISIPKNEKMSQRRFYKACRRIIQSKNKSVLKLKWHWNMHQYLHKTWRGENVVETIATNYIHNYIYIITNKLCTLRKTHLDASNCAAICIQMCFLRLLFFGLSSIIVILILRYPLSSK